MSKSIYINSLEKKEYLDLIEDLRSQGQSYFDEKIMERTIKFCERNKRFMNVFIDCNFDLVLFYTLFKLDGDFEEAQKVYAKSTGSLR